MRNLTDTPGTPDDTTAMLHAATYCGSDGFPVVDHTACPSSVECSHAMERVSGGWWVGWAGPMTWTDALAFSRVAGGAAPYWCRADGTAI